MTMSIPSLVNDSLYRYSENTSSKLYRNFKATLRILEVMFPRHIIPSNICSSHKYSISLCRAICRKMFETS